MRTAPLTTIQGGISRLRTKGGARADSLYDLLNGRVTQDGSVVPRPGMTRFARLPSTTHGLTAFNGKIYVFSTIIQSLSAPFVNLVVAHPTDPTQDIKTIHFAQPFLGFMYVVIEWDNGDIFHYWLRSGGPWQANHFYKIGDIVEPTVPNGLAYQAVRLTSANGPWTPNTPHSTHTQNVTATSASPAVFTAASLALPDRTLVYLGGTAVPTGFTAGAFYYVVNSSGMTFELSLTPAGTPINSSSTGTAVQIAAPDIIEPTVYNGFEYILIATSGATPHSGAIEPIWPETVGASVNEDADAELAGAPVITPNPNNTVPSDVSGRYDHGIV